MERDFRWLIMDKTGQPNLFVLKCILTLISTLFLTTTPAFCKASHRSSPKTTDPNTSSTEPNYTSHIAELKNKLQNKGFTVILQKPFVVIGDEPPETVRSRSIRTVKWSVDKLKQDYYKNDPNKIINIWLFKDSESYNKHTRQFFNERPTTPFGFYSDKHNALIMNIATGGGTLVHEIVHPFMSANFPQCPPWFNEGLASLYEQCREKDGHIYGMTNWRLEGLQKDIRAGKVRPFKDLTSASEFTFYHKPSGDNYAQARYLCYYLQQKNLLTKYYHKFRANCKTDPTGYETLKKILGTKDMKKFQKQWENFVLKLKFP